jgi:hypothetical protein
MYVDIQKRNGTVKDSWKEWPRGFPDKNDYEDVEECGATEDGTKAAWVQSRYFVLLVASEGGKVLRDFADGIWGVVNEGSKIG